LNRREKCGTWKINKGVEMRNDLEAARKRGIGTADNRRRNFADRKKPAGPGGKKRNGKEKKRTVDQKLVRRRKIKFQCDQIRKTRNTED